MLVCLSLKAQCSLMVDTAMHITMYITIYIFIVDAIAWYPWEEADASAANMHIIMPRIPPVTTH